MSIIAEALKKVDKTALREPEEFRPSAKHPSRAFTFVLFCLLLAAALLYFFGRELTTKAHESQALSAPNKASIEKVPLRENSSAGLSANVPINVEALIDLDGIMYTTGKPMAIINNSIALEGELIGNLKIVEIGQDFVKFGYGQREYLVKLKR
jgi:hypothetical protein